MSAKTSSVRASEGIPAGAPAGAPYGRALWLTCLAISLAVTLSVTFIPILHFSYRNPALHVLLSTSDAMIAFLVAFVMYGRFRSSRAVRDLALVIALAILAASNLLFSVVPQITVGDGGEQFAIWAPLASRLLGAVVFAAGAVLPVRIQLSPRRSLAITAFSVAGLAAVIAAIFATASRLPPAIDSAIDPGASQQPLIVGHPVLLAAQVATMVLFAVAAGGFMRTARERGDRVYAWFGAGSIFAAFARVNYFLFPSLYTDFVYAGDVLRLGFYAMLLVGAAHEIRSYWQTRAESEVFHVRNALARDLHDGLAQELVFIAAQTRRLAKTQAQPADIELLNSAADRAVAEARRAIAALTRSFDEPVTNAVAETAEEEARRSGIEVKLDLDDRVAATTEQREALVRITREAVKNAVRHGNASLVTVTLQGSDGIELTIRDDGVGFNPGASPSGPHQSGVVAMSDRARAIGGELYISAAAGGGTEVKVTVPWAG